MRNFVLAVLMLAFCPLPVFAGEESVSQLARLSEEYMRHLDRKEFLAVREMLDPEINQRIPEDTFLRTMASIYEESTVFYEKSRVFFTSSWSAVSSLKVTYFSNTDVEVGCQLIYWVQKQGRWFVSHHEMKILGGHWCI